MTDERIKEEYDVWISDGECTENERLFFSQYPAENHPTAIGFYAGFRTAERLAMKEAADRFCASCHGKEDGMCGECPDRAVILNSPVKEGKTDAEKLAIAVKAFEVIRDNTLNPAHTMTKLGLEETTDANHLLSIKALKEIQ